MEVTVDDANVSALKIEEPCLVSDIIDGSGGDRQLLVVVSLSNSRKRRKIW